MIRKIITILISSAQITFLLSGCEDKDDGVEEEIVSLIDLNDLNIGDRYQGGVIAWFDESRQHGLIAASEDQSDGISWMNAGVPLEKENLQYAIGTGKSNTETIVQRHGNGTYAAKLCYDLVLNGYSDWFLPSKDELNLLFLNREAIGGFEADLYWSSSDETNEYGHTGAWYQVFRNTLGRQNWHGKANKHRVRAVRYF